MKLPVYEFDGYTFRPATAKDLPLARQWNRMDPDHTWELQYPEYWIEQNSQVNSYLLEDAIGTLFFVKSIRHMGNEVEISLQFDRQHGMVSKGRVTRGMEVGFAWLKKALPMNGFTALYFVSKTEELISFTEKRLGFKRDGIRMIYRLEEVRDGG
jgi:hypothetical protein